MTKSLTLAISNIGEEDANSVTMSIPSQTAYEFLGTDKNIIGNIAKNDYTIASFKINPKEDGPLIVKISYTDSIGVRREIEKTVMFTASAFSQKTTNGKEQSGLSKSLIYIIIGVIGLILIFILLRILRRKKKLK